MSFKDSVTKTRPERVKPVRPPEDRTSRRSSISSTSSNASFHSASASPVLQRFSATEEANMLSVSNTLKLAANAQFAAADYSSAIGTYDKALAELPTYLDFELAVLQSNIAACHVKLEQWKEAIEACERGLENLEREWPTQKKKTKQKPKQEKANGNSDSTRTKFAEANSTPTTGKPSAAESSEEEQDEEEGDDKVVELPPDTDPTLALRALSLSDTRKQSILRIRTKLLLRRARAHTSTQPPTLAALSAALTDYTTLSSPPYTDTLPPSDAKTVRLALVTLPPQVEAAKKKEVEMMMGKLKEVGDSVLGWFGLSTDMFKVDQQGEGGGYSLRFDQSAGGAASRREGGGGADKG